MKNYNLDTFTEAGHVIVSHKGEILKDEVFGSNQKTHSIFSDLITKLRISNKELHDKLCKQHNVDVIPFYVEETEEPSMLLIFPEINHTILVLFPHN